MQLPFNTDYYEEMLQTWAAIMMPQMMERHVKFY